MESIIEKWLFVSRWLLVPLYLGLTLIFVALGIKFLQEIVHLAPQLWAMKETDLVLASLTLIDMVLVGNLLIMVILSGYENHVSQLNLEAGQERLSWLGKLDAGSLKVKLSASIVLISSIHLLKAFMDIQQMQNDKLMWMVIVHMTFVISAILMSAIDKMSGSHH
ncbi:MAG: TIGR00645 family protein [Magnetococcales bacterium]|nr:TIGR00645 family protein [Magnetococcales bacterium]MBF0148665.1 TIGR00645 family protein [Magnetococcales bacterium]MBF0174096.1 TIGR00645 family protein [Magnetococcales bacterium]MBF0631471.1 TIGR00645 family protein [Magnetococcales bacterium]